MLRIGVKRSIHSSSSVLGEHSSSLEPPRKRIKVTTEERSAVGRDWWGRRVWNSLVGGFHRLFQRKRRSPLICSPTISDKTNTMDSAQTLNGELQLPSQRNKEVVINSPVLMSTPFPQSQASPLELPLPPPQLIDGSSPSPQSQSPPAQQTPLPPDEDFPSQVIEGSSPSLAMRLPQKCIPDTTSQPQGNTCSKAHSRTSRNLYSATTHSKPVKYTSSINHCRYGSSASPIHHYPSGGNAELSSLFTPVLSPEIIGPSMTCHPFKIGTTSAEQSTSATVKESTTGACAHTSEVSRQPVTLVSWTQTKCQTHPERTIPEIGRDSECLATTYNSRSSHSREIPPRSHTTQQGAEMRKMFTFLQRIKADHDQSVEDRKTIAEAIEKKLKLHQHQRMVLEDARVARLRDQLAITSVSDVNEPVIETLTSLSDNQLPKVAMAITGGPASECLSQKYNIRITRGDLATLVGLQWLNDEVINFYFNMIKDRSLETKSSRRTHVFNTFFYPKLSKTGYSGVRRWTRKVDVFEFDLLLIPVHMGMHWCLAAVDFNNKHISYYDSLHGSNEPCLQRLREYLVEESRDKKGVEFDVSGWSSSTPKKIPHQRNGSDCGVFTCMYARFLSVGSPFKFSQDDMPTIREHMIVEILEQKLF